MEALWHDRQVIVCVGTGGVGKTTVSATIAVAAATAGKKTLVMTIDPARRLAHALGIKGMSNTQHAIDPQLLAPYGVTLKAELHVMMPDVKGTFDDLIARWAPNDAGRNAILNNRIYQHFSSALAGSHEYAAVEKLYEVYTENKYDLIVLDTPPSQNAIDFLEAPSRIVDFLESNAFHWLLKPTLMAGKMSLRLLDLGGSLMVKTLGKVAGAETIRDLAEFLLGFQGMYDGFRERSARVKELLASDALAFVLVSTPAPSQQQSMRLFAEELRRQGLHVRGSVINRVRQMPYATRDQTILETALTRVLAGVAPDDVAAVRDALRDEFELADRDTSVVQTLRDNAQDTQVVALPELPLDAHDLASLAKLHGAFLPEQERSAAPSALHHEAFT